METYNINDLVIGKYTYKDIRWSFGRKIKTVGVKKSVLCRLDDYNYKDVISNSIVPSCDIRNVKSFIAKETRLSKSQVIYIFNALEDLHLSDDSDFLINSEVITPISFAKEVFTDKVKKIGTIFKK